MPDLTVISGEKGKPKRLIDSPEIAAIIEKYRPSAVLPEPDEPETEGEDSTAE